MQAITEIKNIIESKLDWDDDYQKATELLVNSQVKKDITLPNSVEVLPYILELSSDKPTIIATILSDQSLRSKEKQAEIKLVFGDEVASLVAGVSKLNDIAHGDDGKNISPQQAENLRRLLLAIIDDVRVMLIKLCFRVVRLKHLKHNSFEERQAIAKESMDIFAPLANRLGIGHLKWEIEDLSFRALDPQAYKHIAKLLEEKRVDREQFIQSFTTKLTDLIKSQSLEAKVNGRVKHIVSIWRKMQRKNLQFNQLFDVRAVRILVDSLADCYAVLGIVHTTWTHVPAEFDDYIANPKGNGYQSIHTAVIGEGGKIVEIQIRTHEMHEKSEFGVASHWRYKEGVKLDQSMEKSLMTLRELLDNSDEDAQELIGGGLDTELANSRVYVFSPQGKIVDLTNGATALDFAYAIHTNVGHRCRGAKVNGKIVTLTRPLEMAETIEILTAKEAAPSRDWMNKKLGFLKSTGARSKVRNWFNHQDFEQNVLDGKHYLEKELAKFSIRNADVTKLANHFKVSNEAQLYSDLGRGHITGSQVIGFLQAEEKPNKNVKINTKSQSKKSGDKGVSIQGVGNLMTQIANCCKPVLGDSIVGYITVGSGVTIHKQECSNLIHLDETKRQRLIDVEWNSDGNQAYQSDVLIESYDRAGLLKDISLVLSNERLNLININSSTNQQTLLVTTKITVEVTSTEQLSLVIDKLLQISNVQNVKRVND